MPTRLALSAVLLWSVFTQVLLPILVLFGLGWLLDRRAGLAAPLIAVALVPVFGFKGETAAIMIVSSAFPTAVNTALIAHEFGADSHFAAAAVFYSTLCSMLSVTVLIAVLRVA